MFFSSLFDIPQVPAFLLHYTVVYLVQGSHGMAWYAKQHPRIADSDSFYVLCKN